MEGINCRHDTSAIGNGGELGREAAALQDGTEAPQVRPAWRELSPYIKLYNRLVAELPPAELRNPYASQ